MLGHASTQGQCARLGDGGLGGCCWAGAGWLRAGLAYVCLSVILVVVPVQEILDWLVFASLSRQRGPVDPTVPEYYGATMMLLLP